MEKTDYHMTRDTDTEIFMHYIANELRGPKKPDPVKICGRLSKALDGAYNCTFMNAYGDIVVTRDPMGFKPLCYGYKDDILLVASESNALLNCGISADDVKDLPPGHLIAIEDEKVHIKKYAEGPRLSHCMFEWVYFANVASTIDKKSVYLTRNNLGKNLAKIEKVKFYSIFTSYLYISSNLSRYLLSCGYKFLSYSRLLSIIFKCLLKPSAMLTFFISHKNNVLFKIFCFSASL